MSFPPLAPRTVRWRALDSIGLEHLDLRPQADEIVAESVVIGERGDRPYGVRYRVVCDAAWAVRSLDLMTTVSRSLSVRSDGAGRWTDAKGRPLPHLSGCIDIDLAGSPFTNTLPIRRLGIDVGQRPVELRMVYVPFDTFEPTIDEQRYTCLESGRLFRYEAVDGSFSAHISVDEDGLVTDYPPLFIRAPIETGP
ncbi:MAG TPA: putative glycolipid-binding domain-containing protein [Xanthobacteraceae bacterium]|nr:putative glycolipid-binding domain-containing protein [Xanthobacteraceae bacterium]